MKRKQWLDSKIGARFGILTVLGAAREPDDLGYLVTLARVKCDCGTEKLVEPGNLKTGRSQSCGCAISEKCRRASTKHGMAFESTYWVWRAMRQRCRDKNSNAYANYGGRGIKVCDRWMVFENFLADMGKRPPGMWLDRIDNSGNYGPTNCRWSTPSEQASNRRRRHSSARCSCYLARERKVSLVHDMVDGLAVGQIRSVIAALEEISITKIQPKAA